MKDVTAAHAPARHHGDDGLRAGADLALQVENVEARRAVVTHIAARPADLLVAARAEGLFAHAGQDDDADVCVVAGVVERAAHLHHRLRTEGVVNLGTVDRDLGDTVRALLIDDVGEFARLVPFGNGRKM